MKKVTTTIKSTAAIAIVIAVVSLTSCNNGEGNSKVIQEEVATLRAQLKELSSTNETIAKNLATFDTLDFKVFSNQDWVRFHESHAKDIIVHFPDGHTTTGLDVHIKDMKAMFVYAPDTRITEHPIKVGSGNITAVTGIMEGTFTQPMPIGDGKFIQPTGKSFKLPMATFGIWKNGLMSEEYLYWDNKTYMAQMGL